MNQQTTKTETIAFPSNDGSTIEQHFGHCRLFVAITVSDGKVVSRDALDPPPHVPGALPAFLSQQGADTVITGGMGARAVDLFRGQGINVILGATGSIDETLKQYLAGDLASTGSVCEHHGHGDHDHHHDPDHDHHDHHDHHHHDHDHHHDHGGHHHRHHHDDER